MHTIAAHEPLKVNNFLIMPARSGVHAKRLRTGHETGLTLIEAGENWRAAACRMPGSRPASGAGVVGTCPPREALCPEWSASGKSVRTRGDGTKRRLRALRPATPHRLCG